MYHMSHYDYRVLCSFQYVYIEKLIHFFNVRVIINYHLSLHCCFVTYDAQPNIFGPLNCTLKYSD